MQKHLCVVIPYHSFLILSLPFSHSHSIPYFFFVNREIKETNSDNIHAREYVCLLAHILHTVLQNKEIFCNRIEINKKKRRNANGI